jgi:hypothetical protein
MKNVLLLALLVFIFGVKGESQELFVYSEPASNMPSKTVGFKFTGLFPGAATFKQRYKPEVMFGINQNWMVHLSSTFSNYYTSNVRYESAKAYAKYRFYSNDDVHTHFRMAAFADVSFSRSPYTFDEMTLEGDNSGAQLGLIATKLVNKLAVSGTVSYTGFFPENKTAMHNGERSLNMFNYSLSTGYLVLPREYVNYNQPNLNVYLEVLGANSLDNKQYVVDVAAALQLILNSNTKLNFGYRFQLTGNMSRMSERTWLFGLEHTIFNAWK